MNHYAQIGADGICVSQLMTSGEVEGDHIVPITEQQYAGGVAGLRYVDGAFAPLPAALAPRRLAPLAFRRRFTAAERAAIEWAAVDKPEQSAQERMGSAALRSSLKDQDQATYIDLDDLDTITGTHAIEQLGLIGAGRADEILGAPVEPGERP